MNTKPVTPRSGPPLITVGLGLVIGSQGVLITRRRQDAVLGGLWEFPGGKVEPGESVASCVVREMKEELGLVVEPVEAMKWVEHTYDHGTVRLEPYLCRLAAGREQQPQAIGVAAWRWVPAVQLHGYAFPPANGPILDQLLHLAGKPSPEKADEIDQLHPGCRSDGPVGGDRR